jgi:dienelactone hydrolase
MIFRAAFATLLLLLAALPARAQPVRIDETTIGAPRSGKPVELYLPQGPAPDAGVIVLHGCDGVGPHYREWADRLAQWGYAALLIDSFNPRGFRQVCNHGELVPPELQAADAFAGAAYLRARPDLHIQQVGVVGFSHGGWAVLKAVLAGVARPPNEPPFAAAVAYYPGCDPPTTPLETDTLILIGSADDWTPAARCERWRAMANTNGHALAMTVYPGAFHGFDSPFPPHDYAGHHVGSDPAARPASIAAAQAFFAARLGR